MDNVRTPGLNHSDGGPFKRAFFGGLLMTGIKLVRAAGAPTSGQSKIGGVPALDSAELISSDRSGKPMDFLAQINFGELATEPRGMLLVFIASDIERAQAKDRKSYRFIWQPTGAPDAVQQDVDSGIPMIRQEAANTTNEDSASDTAASASIICEVFPVEHKKLDEARMICAFSSNGISYNEARAKDDLYSHLAVQAPKYQPLFHLKLDSNIDYLALIHEDDLATKMFEKSWLLRLKRA